MNGSTLQKGLVPLPAGSMAVYTSSGLDHYRHSDWLGSNRLCSSPSRVVTCDVAFGPYGETYAPSGSSDPSFTGMNQDTAANLYDFPAREYGTQGRWPSPDPAGILSADPSDPQTWNRYAYVRNSPLTLTDPTGLDGEGGGGCNPLDPTCPGSGGCTFDYCNPGILPELPGPVVNIITGPTATTGLPQQGIFATGPGIDYSWQGLLSWAFGLSGCGISGCVFNWGTGPNGQSVGSWDGEQVSPRATDVSIGICIWESGRTNPQYRASFHLTCR